MNKAYFSILVFILSFLQVHAQEKYFQMGADYLKYKNKDYLAITFKNEKGWHSYWKNPGDAGLPVIVKFETLKLKELAWPAPHTYIQEDILSYGYSGQYTFFYEVNPAQKKLLTASAQEIQAQVLICNQICIPGSEKLTVQLLPNNQLKTISSTSSLNKSPDDLIKRFKDLPQVATAPKDLIINFARMGEDLYLHSSYPANLTNNFHSSSNFITPYPNELLGLMKEELYLDKQNQTIHSLIQVAWEGEYVDPPKEIKDIEQARISFPLEYLLQQNGKFIKASSPIKQLIRYPQDELQKIRSLQKYSYQVEQGSSQSIWIIMLFAFIGGLILNLMPCVLPVISIKLFGLINSRAETDKSRLLKHNLTYTLGVLSTFTLLAFSIHLIKSTGQQVGWGFQLQSPSFVFFMVIIIFLMGLNMLGLFEFKTPGGQKLGGAKLKESFFGDFFSGVISTILSTPCSAPFLGSALTFAFTTTSFNIYLIFLCVGVGLSAPFILIGFFPALISFLPKPGIWMQKLKVLLGLALLVTTVWLVSVFFSLTQSTTALLVTSVILTSITGMFFAKKKRKTPLAIALMLVSIFTTIILFQQGYHQVSKVTSIGTTNENWKPWTPGVMTKTQSVKFINFTAQWCLTCKVNKKLILDRDSFYQFAKDNSIELFEADWTRRDEAITKWLAHYKVVGVPAYFLQKANGDIIHLGETTSIDEIKNSLSYPAP